MLEIERWIQLDDTSIGHQSRVHKALFRTGVYAREYAGIAKTGWINASRPCASHSSTNRVRNIVYRISRLSGLNHHGQVGEACGVGTTTISESA
jgi:hypothetical protein